MRTCWSVARSSLCWVALVSLVSQFLFVYWLPFESIRGKVITQSPTSDVGLEETITILIKAFERGDCLQRCVTSIRSFYPRIPIYVADDSLQPLPTILGVTKTFRLAFNVGAAFGRNFLVDQVTTPYLLFVDDDFVFTQETNLTALIHTIRSTGADLVGANLFERGHYRGFDSMVIVNQTLIVIPNVTSSSTSLHLQRTSGEEACVQTNYVLQFFLARTSTLQHKVRWDPALKTVEHEDFLLSAGRENLVMLTCPSVRAHHNPESSACSLSSSHQRYRSNVTDYLVRTLVKWNLTSIEENGAWWTLGKNGSELTIFKEFSEWKKAPLSEVLLHSMCAQEAVLLLNSKQHWFFARSFDSQWEVWKKPLGKIGDLWGMWLDAPVIGGPTLQKGKTNWWVNVLLRDTPKDPSLPLSFSQLLYFTNLDVWPLFALHFFVPFSERTMEIVEAISWLIDNSFIENPIVLTITGSEDCSLFRTTVSFVIDCTPMKGMTAILQGTSENNSSITSLILVLGNVPEDADSVLRISRWLMSKVTLSNKVFPNVTIAVKHGLRYNEDQEDFCLWPSLDHLILWKSDLRSIDPALFESDTVEVGYLRLMRLLEEENVLLLHEVFATSETSTSTERCPKSARRWAYGDLTLAVPFEIAEQQISGTSITPLPTSWFPFLNERIAQLQGNPNEESSRSYLQILAAERIITSTSQFLLVEFIRLEPKKTNDRFVIASKWLALLSHPMHSLLLRSETP